MNRSLAKLRKLEIIATVGPTCDSTSCLKAMIEACMNVTRLNQSHGEETFHAEIVAQMR